MPGARTFMHFLVLTKF